MTARDNVRRFLSTLSTEKSWQDTAPIRSDLFGTERLEHHAETLATAQTISLRPPKVASLSRRLRDNVAVLLSAYRASAASLQRGETVTPAAEWLLDNFHLVELQLRQITDDLPPGYYKQLPKLGTGPLAGYPRVFGIAWGYIAHTDSLISGPILIRFVAAYQRVQPLQIGELWAIAITLRIVLVENMRRLAVQIAEGQAHRSAADALVDNLLASGRTSALPFHRAVAQYDTIDLPEIFAAQLVRRLRGFDPAETPLYSWLEERLRLQGTSADDVVARALHRQGASNVTMRNIVTSMRLISELDWADFFESVSPVDARLRAAGDFDAMDFSTRNRYRDAIEALARGSQHDELAVTDQAVTLAAVGRSDRDRDPGFILIGRGRAKLEAALKYVPPLRDRLYRQIAKFGLQGYLVAVALTSCVILVVALWATGATDLSLVSLAIIGILPASELGTALVHLTITRGVSPKLLPGMKLANGVPDHLRTLVAVPILMTSKDDLLSQIERLEVHFLSSIDGAVHYALLSDGPDAQTETVEIDASFLSDATKAIAQLNLTYPSVHGNRFLLLHRRRLWNDREGCWMGWERKRGKLTELNRLLRGATDTTFMALPDTASVPSDIRYVITLDADTRIPRDTVRSLIGKMAHPLNKPYFDPSLQRVTDGYGILQPRVTPALPIGAEGSVFQQVYSSPGGIEPYAAAISDVYQDLFSEGTFTGKGIYDVDAFDAALAGRVPDNSMLSHDLFEGNFARAGLASDIEVVEDFPSRYDVAARRQHRWIRGDWQLWPWLFAANRLLAQGISPLGRWKMVDNLRRSLVAPSSVLGLFVGWLLPVPQATVWTLSLLIMLSLPRLLSLPFAVMPARRGVSLFSHFKALADDSWTALHQIALNTVFLADEAALMFDAIARTAWRLVVTKRRFLEWVTAAQSAAAQRPGMIGQYRSMALGVGLGLGLSTLAILLNPSVWSVALPIAALWLVAPLVAYRISLPNKPTEAALLSADQTQYLRLIARRTWRYFETFVTEADNFLPPDNYQETPRAAVANRTSPTNIGLYLLSVIAARDMGWIGQGAALLRLEQTLGRMQMMPRFRGHFYNWYNTQDLRVLDPAYVSSVDSGNFAGHLVAVAQSCLDWINQTDRHALRAGVLDACLLAKEALSASGYPESKEKTEFTLVYARLVVGIADISADQKALHALAQTIAKNAVLMGDTDSDLAFWTNALCQRLAETDQSGVTADRLKAVAAAAQRFAAEMEFGFLLDPEKELLSIGFSVSTNSLDTNCYDLLASEARLASLFAIAKKDIATRHWFRLGRAATPLGAGSALISWSGSMFEYLMPSLVMRAPAGSILEQTNRLIVTRQQAYAAALGIPWGISESSYNARDLEMTYQYSNFGIPGLGLKRGLSQNRVIAPYATGLACMIDPVAAVANYKKMAAMGAEGRYGFYEALDFTAARLPEGETMAVVRSFMAHHQGMTITAISNALQSGCLRSRFHASPMIQAVDLLLQERVPRDVATARPRAEEVTVGAASQTDVPVVRRFDSPATAPRTAHHLSNGRYGVMLTPTGAGYSRWGDLAITRWRADATQDVLGSFIFMRDVQTGMSWSASEKPFAADEGHHRAVFCEHHAAFTRTAQSLTSLTEIVVSAEDDAEARRVTFTNTGRRTREIDVTSYAELVLAPPATDLAHQAFSKMFVVTDFLPELGVIIATRRRRAPTEAEVWVAHIAVVEGTETAPIQFETDRAQFIGRGRTLAQALPTNAPLSGTTGTVLDPVFSIRRRVLVPAGGVARVTFWTMAASNPAVLLELVDRHRDPSAFERASTLAWTQAQVQLRHVGITNAEAADFQTLAGIILRADPRLRASPARIEAGAGPQSGLWAHGISGDLPVVLMLIEDIEDIDQVHQVLSAQEYWRSRQIAFDLVILNERSSSYVQDLQIALETAVRAAQARPMPNGTAVGGSYTLRSDLIPASSRALLLSVARVVLTASRGDIGQQIAGLTDKPKIGTGVDIRPRPTQSEVVDPAIDNPDISKLEFFNGTGGFDLNGREYVIILKNGQTTPAPWINVIANPTFGIQVSAEGSGYVWSENSRENQITPWSNDPVTDAPGEAIYLCDLESGAVWTPTALPIRGKGTYVARHGFGYSRFDHRSHGIDASMVQFVPLDSPARVTKLTLHNATDRPRRLSVTAYSEWVLGTSRSATAATVTTEIDSETGAIFAHNPWSTAFPGRVAFADIGAQVDGWTGDRVDVLGSGGTISNPLGLQDRPLSGRTGAALDPCAAQQRLITLAPGQSVDLRLILGQASTNDAARDVISNLRDADLDILQAAVADHWSDLLDAVQIATPDRSMDVMLNGWLLYQTLVCRIWARAGFYQASGAYGFRDQLQDGMALTFARPDITRAHLLRAASRQFPQGDVQHWWLPHSGQGVRTRISDDRVWLGYCVAQYVATTADIDILKENVSFLEGPALLQGAHDDFFLPTLSDLSTSLFDHCARGIDQSIALTGANGMPLIGTGDWNDGMNRVGEAGQGTSVWLGWLLIATIRAMAPFADSRDPARAAAWRSHAESVRIAIEREGWDGSWYRRGTFDDGSALGSAMSDECQIDSIAQSWGVISGAADPIRAATAMAAVDSHLIRRDPALVLLFAPPFDRTSQEPGYIKGYPPGLRENGGQYSHAAMWAVLAQAQLGNGDRAADLFSLLNPINHALTATASQRYTGEPYVIAADVYSTAPHEGRAGWTWYTGSAAWMYRAGIEGILGLTRAGDVLIFNPTIPKGWPSLSAKIRLGGTHIDVLIENPNQTGLGIVSAIVDGVQTQHLGGAYFLPMKIGQTDLRLVLG